MGGREEDEIPSAHTVREMLQLGRLCLDGGVYGGVILSPKVICGERSRPPPSVYAHFYALIFFNYVPNIILTPKVC